MIEGLLLQQHPINETYEPQLPPLENKTLESIRKLAIKTFQVAYKKPQKKAVKDSFTEKNLLEMINNPEEDSDIKCIASYLLTSLKTPSQKALNHLKALTQHPSHLAVVASLHKWGIFTDKERAILIRCLSNPLQDIENKELALAIWVSIQPQSNLLHKQLLHLLSQESEELIIRELAIKLLLHLNPKFNGFQNHLEKILSDEEEGKILYTAFLATIYLQKEKVSSLERVYDTLQDTENFQLQLAAIKALEFFQSIPQEIHDYLKKVFLNDSEEITLRKEALLAWLRIEKDPLEKERAFLGLLEDEKNYPLLASKDLKAFLPSETLATVILEKLKSTEDEATKEAATKILAHLKPVTQLAQEQLLSLALDKNTSFYLRTLCIKSLGEMGPFHQEAQKSLLSLAISKKQAPEIRYQALQTLAKSSPPSFIFPILLNLIGNKKAELEMREYAIKALCLRSFDSPILQKYLTQIVLNKKEATFLRYLAISHLQNTLAPVAHQKFLSFQYFH